MKQLTEIEHIEVLLDEYLHELLPALAVGAGAGIVINNKLK